MRGQLHYIWGLILLGVGEGDEVICQSFTFSASAKPDCLSEGNASIRG